ncbi:MAG TPA: carbonic anhydrase [Terracidiphilus sp.]|nr:carbonic anhydrase [Terracidiphilus sp.]
MLLQEGPGIDYLRRGVRHFRSEVFPRNRELYENLAEKQVPHALFLTCGDSRIDPTALTSTEPGEIFVERTPGNIVPIYSDAVAVGVSASIEYSVVVLGVSHVIVCGHSACGAMKALLEPEELHEIPATARWLKFAEAPALLLKQNYGHLEEHERLKRLSQLNVVEQISHLRTHPAVDGRLKDHTLAVHGWYYEIHTGRVEVYNTESGQFEEWE